MTMLGAEQEMGLPKRPPSKNQIRLADAIQKREAVRRFMENMQLTQSAVAKLSGMSKTSVSRALHQDPPTLTRSLRKLHGLALGMSDQALLEAMQAIGRLPHGSARHNSIAVVHLLRALADLLERQIEAKG